MTTKHYVKDEMQVSETIINDKISIVAVFVPFTEAGSAHIDCYVYKPDEPYLRGEDYPALVEVWNNQEDDIYDAL